MITVVSRASELAVRQTKEVLDVLPHLEFRHERVTTFGDENKGVALETNTQADIFTDTLDRMLLEGKADIAVHSAKDLQFPLRDGLVVLAVTDAADPSDSLVTRGNVPLAKLPAGARVGTSSPRRSQQILALRPDLKLVSIRGTIEQRIAQVDNADVDALIVATCALKRLGLDNRIADVLPIETHPLQGRLAVVARRGMPSLHARFRPLDARVRWGKVWIVGGGPADPDLLTVKACAALARADVIFHDDLTATVMLDEYPGEKICVGKRKGHAPHTQDDINEMLYRAALAGKSVARLKGGDPMIFGRGGEESMYLRERLVAVEIIPGISAANAAAASTHIPLTARGVAPSVTIASAHHDPDMSYGPHDETRVFYMAATKLGQVADELRACGKDGHTPVAIIEHVGAADERTRITTVDALAAGEAAQPSLIIAGNVVAQHAVQERFLYTGLDATAWILPGAVMHYPLIAVRPVPHKPVDLSRYDALIFTSKNAVQCFLAAYATEGKVVFSIGKATARELRKRGCIVHHIASPADSDALAELVQSVGPHAALYPCSALSKNALNALPCVTSMPLYTTEPAKRAPIPLDGFDGVIFMSPSTVTAFFGIFDRMPDAVACYVFGSRTHAALVRYGIDASVITTLTLPGSSE